MTDATATLHDTQLFNGRVFHFDACRRLVRHVVVGAAFGLGGVAASGALVIAVTAAAAWFIATIIAASPNLPAKPANGAVAMKSAKHSSLLTVARPASTPVSPEAANALSFEVRWAQAMTLPGMHDNLETLALKRAVARPKAESLTAAQPQLPPAFFAPRVTAVPHLLAMAELPSGADLGLSRHAVTSTDVATPPPIPPTRAATAERSSDAEYETPLPRPYPGNRETARPLTGQSSSPIWRSAPPSGQSSPRVEPRVASLEPPASPFSGLRFPFPLPWDHPTSLPGQNSHTAVYDIAAHTVYLPNGERLEAHSGLGEKMDNPRYIRVKNRGPTPPNVYDLALREQLFHGVQAIRLKPVNENKMFGRDGMLAHTYMLGPNGQSNGCVSFRNYARFLRAVKSGQVTRLVVVPHLGNTFVGTAGARNESGGRFGDSAS